MVGQRGLREQILEHIAQFSFASMIGGIGLFFSNYIAARVLGPSTWGLWQGVRLVLVYGACLHLGAQYGMQRELPILRGRGETVTTDAIINVAYTIVMLAAVIVSILVFLVAWMVPIDREARVMLLFVAGMLFLEYVRVFYGTLLRATNRFGIVSRVTMIDGAGHVASAGLAAFTGLFGFLVGQIVRLTADSWYSLRTRQLIPRFQWDNALARSLVVIGFPIMLSVFAHAALTSSDKMLILSLLGSSELGYYSLGTLIFMPLLVIFGASNSVMFPRFAERFGQTGRADALRGYVIEPIGLLASVVSVLVGMIFLGVDWATGTFLPEYLPGVDAARVLLIGQFFHALAGMAGNLLVTIDRQRVYLAVLAGGAVLNLCLSYAALRLGFGIAGVAAATSVSFAAYFICLAVLAMRFTASSRREIVKLMWRAMWPLAYVLAAIGVVELTATWLPSAMLGWRDVGRILAKEMLFVLLTGWVILTSLRSARISWKQLLRR
jgi:O-antigen/teichoic acid export membrane protein